MSAAASIDFTTLIVLSLLNIMQFAEHPGYCYADRHRIVPAYPCARTLHSSGSRCGCASAVSYTHLDVYKRQGYSYGTK